MLLKEGILLVNQSAQGCLKPNDDNDDCQKSTWKDKCCSHGLLPNSPHPPTRAPKANESFWPIFSQFLSKRFQLWEWINIKAILILDILTMTLVKHYSLIVF